MDLVYVGCYTPDAGSGTGIRTFSHSDGTLTPVGELAMTSPSWLAWHPTLPVLYAANESAEGTITTVRTDPLRAAGTVSSGGADPCHLAVTPDGRYLLCSNYTSGSLAVFALDHEGTVAERTDLVTHDGSGPVTERQASAHVHMAVPLATADGTVVSAVDLGTDQIVSYTLTEGQLTRLATSALPPGTGPRQLVRKEGNDLAYVAGELAGTLIAVREDPVGTFTPLSVVRATAAEYPGVTNYVAHLEITGDRLYVSNRGPDCVTEFDVSAPEPRAVADHPCGAFPRHFTIAGDRLLVASQLGGEITAVPLDGGEPVRTATGSPSYVEIR
ncbi:lactonase family protein [Amycolatopsis suaedae]|uniref:Lactonase family protein n=1 Tax=Amycolatopsis suaedae TaxID=2510978 RepID=A0A4Q7J016_9PSEU|nr:beta-propeller fold lactonase family protein [Amycolatopsis suaedae]RZQ60119.1 lactonase family protein [Amycolatopsis suaedae]